MKKFIIISTILILLAAGAFGYSVYHYLQVTAPAVQPAPAATEVTATADDTQEATEPAMNQNLATDLGEGGIFSAYYDKAKADVATMSKEEMVGQMLLGICSSTDTALSDVKHYALAGLLFESGNFYGMTEEEIKAVLESVRLGADVAPILAAQEEGGYVTTVSDLDAFPNVSFSSPMTLYLEGGLQAVEKAEDEKAAFLKGLGFNLNLAPVVDLPDSMDQIMFSRSLSSDAKTVAAYAEYAAKFNQAKGVSVALKHFPGYGTIPDAANTDVGAVIDDRSADTIRSVDYVPFKSGAKAGAHFIMMSNVVVQNIDPSHTAALSPALHKELRDDVGFSGLILTDVIDKTDYSAYADGNKTAVAAVLAGNDIILARDYATAYADILAAVNDGTIDPAIIQTACTRVIAYKYAAGLLG